ncbi:MAG: HAMP domain-containing histidine kinase [Oscillospiraceae bacterium]|nr:HAMP domain-containing histidine kinase [Oscillospiraceae bacterium]
MKQAAKLREAFEHIRNKNNVFSLRARLVVLVAAEVVGSVLLAVGVAWLLEVLLPDTVRIPLILELVVFSLLIGSLITTFMSKLFFDPIKKLGDAMEKVADGDFTVQIETKSSSKEIQEIYSGFNLMTHELNATEVLQTDFVSNVSHEFKTPINAIEGYTMLLQGGEGLDEDQQQYVEKILFNTKRLSDLVGNILLLSKIENQTIQTNQTKYRLDEQIRQSIVALEPEWSEKEIEFDVDMENIEYTGNEGLMRHVWDNLISNAIKFNPVGGFVRIMLEQQDDRIVFTIEDSGPGISDEATKHIFDKFYQGDSSHKEEGNGLGLALVKRILAIAGGEIFAENIQNGGCRFIVTLKA